jgi:transcriptional/translational regulatory protein YebC/TACO1
VIVRIEHFVCISLIEGGGTNPKLNNALARVMDDGKTKDVPMNTMTEMLRKLVSKF